MPKRGGPMMIPVVTAVITGLILQAALIHGCGTTLGSLLRPAAVPPLVPTPMPLETILARELESGWVVEKPPAIPGPYLLSAEQPFCLSQTDVSGRTGVSGTVGGVKYSLTSSSEADQMILFLVAPDSALAPVYLIRYRK